MDLPFEILIHIFSFNKILKCYRCNKKILPCCNYISYERYIFCCEKCIEYQHY